STGSVIIPPGQEQGGSAGLVAPSHLPSTVLTEVDVSDPDEPSVVSTQQVDGGYRTARSADGTARIVLVSDPYLDGSMPLIADDGSFDDQAAEDREADDWLPAVTLVGTDGEVERSPLVE